MEEREINIADLLWIAWRKLWVILLAFAIFATAAFCYCEFIAVPSYKATASVLVTNGAISTETEGNTNKTTVAATDISASLGLAETITDILKTPDIYKRLAAEIPGDYSYDRLMNMCSISRRSDDSLFVDVQFVNSSPTDAMMISNKFADIACDYITEYIPYSNALVSSTAVKATLNYPRTTSTTAIAGILGAVLAYAMLLIIEFTNNTIKGEDDFVSNFEIPLLGSVPDFENAEEEVSYGKRGGKKNGKK